MEKNSLLDISDLDSKKAGSGYQSAFKKTQGGGKQKFFLTGKGSKHGKEMQFNFERAVHGPGLSPCTQDV